MPVFTVSQFDIDLVFKIPFSAGSNLGYEFIKTIIFDIILEENVRKQGLGLNGINLTSLTLAATEEYPDNAFIKNFFRTKVLGSFKMSIDLDSLLSKSDSDAQPECMKLNCPITASSG